jgi:hypothetical protein
MGRVRRHMRGTSEVVLVLAATVLGGGHLTGQQAETASSDRVVRAAGPRYQASGLHNFLFGKEYRSLWSTPISVPLLDLRAFAGGLKPVSKGGGQQTKSLLLAAQDGREFFFRSVDKDPSALQATSSAIRPARHCLRRHSSLAPCSMRPVFCMAAPACMCSRTIHSWETFGVSLRA